MYTITTFQYLNHVLETEAAEEECSAPVAGQPTKTYTNIT